ncbi:DUF1361 domain-containing protein [Terrimonas pollutisoli]|uniref:DUF1361 domain-containing protein n=1 Tax=Terrimonas pollutisoli TaxID=3034147 RepID=UPI0023ED3C23|nr:DUF1361 domain-containing protein [Terrimonas sp. H1YJ31]
MFPKYFLVKKALTTLTIQDLLLISCGFSCLLLIGRAAATGLITYAFLLWNLFLAFVPYGITQWLSGQSPLWKSKPKLIITILGWLVFIPNSFYIITDLFHLDTFDSAPKWFDLLLLFSFAWNGLLLGILSVRTLEKIIEAAWGRDFSSTMLVVVMWLNAFGIYIGRYLRFNSWDIIAQPFSLFSEMFEVIFHPIKNKMEWGDDYCVCNLLVIALHNPQKIKRKF